MATAPHIIYQDTAWLDSQQAYNLNAGVDLQLDWLRKILRSSAYMYRGFVFPTIGTPSSPGPALVAPLDSVNGNLAMLPGTYFVQIAGISATAPQMPNPGFMLQIFDEGAGAYIYNGQFGHGATVAGNFGTPLGFAAGQPIGSHLFYSPMIVLPPGRISWQITNLASTPAAIQILLDTAVPISDTSLGNSKGA